MVAPSYPLLRRPPSGCPPLRSPCRQAPRPLPGGDVSATVSSVRMAAPWLPKSVHPEPYAPALPLISPRWPPPTRHSAVPRHTLHPSNVRRGRAGVLRPQVRCTARGKARWNRRMKSTASAYPQQRPSPPPAAAALLSASVRRGPATARSRVRARVAGHCPAVVSCLVTALPMRALRAGRSGGAFAPSHPSGRRCRNDTWRCDPSGVRRRGGDWPLLAGAGDM